MRIDLRFDEDFPHPIDAVWRAVTDRRVLARWLMDNDFEPRAGHKFKLRDPGTPSWRGWVDCEVLEIDPPRRMVWSWDGGSPGEGVTRVVFELHPAGTGTRLVFRHEGDITPEQGEALRGGWGRKMRNLRATLGPDYARRVAFGVSPEQVFDAITTLEGLRGWWTTLVTGSAVAGGEFKLEFEGLDEHIMMRVDKAVRPSSVHWTCVEHTELDDWNGTRIQFDLAPHGPGRCELGFRHVGLRPALECYETCEQGWDHFLASLGAYVMEGEGTPFGAERRARRAHLSKKRKP
jgi:uncharacterized protein YndB with AHSA1/START domain